MQKIKTEKEQLIKVGKIKRQRSLPQISDEEKPFELPDSWEWERIGNYTYNLAGLYELAKQTACNILCNKT